MFCAHEWRARPPSNRGSKSVLRGLFARCRLTATPRAWCRPRLIPPGNPKRKPCCIKWSQRSSIPPVWKQKKPGTPVWNPRLSYRRSLNRNRKSLLGKRIAARVRLGPVLCSWPPGCPRRALAGSESYGWRSVPSSPVCATPRVFLGPRARTHPASSSCTSYD
jgi:hypothetical protein